MPPFNEQVILVYQTRCDIYGHIEVDIEIFLNSYR